MPTSSRAPSMFTSRRLRKALNGEGKPDIIRTVRAAGYSLAL